MGRSVHCFNNHVLVVKNSKDLVIIKMNTTYGGGLATHSKITSILNQTDCSTEAEFWKLYRTIGSHSPDLA